MPWEHLWGWGSLWAPKGLGGLRLLVLGVGVLVLIVTSPRNTFSCPSFLPTWPER